MFDPEALLASALEQVQIAASQIKQKHAMEAKIWQNKAQELQGTIDSLQAQLRDLQKANAQIRASLDEKTAEAEKLRVINASLTQSLQEKEQSIAKYVTLNQSLRGLLGEHPDEPVRPALSRLDFSAYQTPVGIHEPNHGAVPQRAAVEQRKPRSPVERPQASQGSLFIRAAKEELTYTDFNQMIAEINRYNKHQQTREETMAHVQSLLCPAHRNLFEQFLPMIGGT
jgi:hypothetical protein